MKDENYDQGSYPQEITDDERALGFESGLLEAYGLPNETIPPLQDTPVVVKRLNSSDVLVKILFFDKITYSHKRYATDKTNPTLRAEWWPLNDPISDAQLALDMVQKGITNAPYIQDLIPQKFSFQSKKF